MAIPSTIRVSTWHELQAELYRDAWQAELERFRPSVAFRCVAHACDELVNSLARLGSVSFKYSRLSFGVEDSLDVLRREELLYRYHPRPCPQESIYLGLISTQCGQKLSHLVGRRFGQVRLLRCELIHG